MIFCRLPWQCTPLWIRLFGDIKSCSCALKQLQIKNCLFQLALVQMTLCPPRHCWDRNVAVWAWLCVPYAGVCHATALRCLQFPVQTPFLHLSSFSGSLFCCHDFTAFASCLPTSGNTRTCVEAQRFVCLLPARLSEGDGLTGRGVCVKWEGRRQMKKRGDRERGRQRRVRERNLTDGKEVENSTGAVSTVHRCVYIWRRIINVGILLE